VGVVPGVGTAASAGMKGIAGTARLTAGARAVGRAGGSARLLKSANRMDKGLGSAAKYLSKTDNLFAKSVPMRGADWVMKTAGFQTAASSVSKYLGASTAGMATKAVAKSSAHLGIASAVSNFWHGPEAMMESAIHGAVAGGLFKGLAHIPGMTGTTNLHKSLRAATGATMMTAGTLAQGDDRVASLVYNFMLGAYFGWKEMPWYRQKSLEYIQDQHAIHKVKPYTVAQAPGTSKWLDQFGESRPKVEKALREITNELGSIKTAPSILKAIGRYLPKSDHEKLGTIDIKGLTESEKYEGQLQESNDLIKHWSNKEKEYTILGDAETKQTEKDKIIKARQAASDIVEKITVQRDKIRKLYDEALIEQNRKSHITEENIDGFEEKLHSLNKLVIGKPVGKKDVKKDSDKVEKEVEIDQGIFVSPEVSHLSAADMLAIK
jgi:hypothetical protein